MQKFFSFEVIRFVKVLKIYGPMWKSVKLLEGFISPEILSSFVVILSQI